MKILEQVRPARYMICFEILEPTRFSYILALIPRYVRVNTLTWSTEEAVETFLSRGYTLSNPMEFT